MANRSESHFRKPSRLANSANQRGSSSRGGEGAATTGLPPPPSSSSNSHSSSFSTKRSFKKSNGQGTEKRVIAASANSDSNAPVARAVQNAAPQKSPSLDCTIRPSESSSQRSNRAVPKAPSSQSRSGTSDSTAQTTTTQESYVQQSKSIPEPTVSIHSPSQLITPLHHLPAVSVEKLPLSASNFPFLTGETASIMNNTGRRRESVRRSNSIKDQPKTPSKKDQRHSQPQLQAETSNSADSSRDAPSYPDNMQAPPLKLVETTASILTWPSPGLEYGRSLEGGVSETVECKATPAPLDSCEDECAGESLPDVHVDVADAPVEGTSNARVGGDSTCGTSNKSSVETVSGNQGDVHNVKQYDCTLQEIQPKEGILGLAEAREF
ncbi:hypothetical protein L1049_027192 [Liquidambar formosana]|uniref:Uncharacterized protein n=1 Tax=Liquidambar formosana TaxID=63359 RepID=A0AAP0N6I8_LIQFO